MNRNQGRHTSTHTVKLRKALCCAAELTILVNRQGGVEEFYGPPAGLLGDDFPLSIGDPIDKVFEESLFQKLLGDTPEALEDRGRSEIVTLANEKNVELRMTKLPREPLFVLVLRDVTPQTRELETLRRQNLLYAADLARTYARWKDGVQQIHTTAKQAAQAERLSLLGQVAAGLAHEAKNLLMPVTLYSQLLREKSRDLGEEGHRLTEGIYSAAERVANLLHQILDAGKPGDHHLEPVTIEALVETVLTIMGSTLRRKGVVLNVEIDEDLPLVEANPQDLEQVLVNLIANALDAIEEAGLTTAPGRAKTVVQSQVEGEAHPTPRSPTISLEAFVEAKSAEGAPPVVVFRVRDNGPGIPPETLSQIFDPFFTTKGAHQGTGLGLFVAHETIRGLGGTMEATSAVGQGALFEIRLPGMSPRKAEAPPLTIG